MAKRTTFECMLAASPSAAIVGRVSRGTGERTREILSTVARHNRASR